jgi:hypothetical protein
MLNYVNIRLMTGKDVEGNFPKFESTAKDIDNLRQGKHFTRRGWQEYMTFS